jgi:hypothetical protein
MTSVASAREDSGWWPFWTRERADSALVQGMIDRGKRTAREVVVTELLLPCLWDEEDDD